MVQEVTAEIGAEFPEVPIAEHVVEGPAGPALLSQAADASLLVVGARGRAAFPGMLLGSVAEYCVRNGPCPVVVVRAPARSALLIFRTSRRFCPGTIRVRIPRRERQVMPAAR
jgi:hypothetical protein